MKNFEKILKDVGEIGFLIDGKLDPLWPAFVKWCDDKFLKVNISKTKELIIYYR